ncbi:SPAC6G9.14 [Symbiodinium pilosum]|uniref:SPAC6G9.14 protein n=1 Tax=Symbiodinium pilosum TaxID=2952 RepID=A0A812W6G0_SYMPI|nr:SPAC6G9.14 [Symbiodinium pilosum]
MKRLFLVLGTASGLSSKGRELPPDPAKVALPAVPGVRNAVCSAQLAFLSKRKFPKLGTVSRSLPGMPELPSLDDIMFGISSEAKQLEAKMLKIEHENGLRLQRQKAVFDRKLKEQEAKNQGVAKENADLAKSIMQLKLKNEATFAKSKTLREAIKLRKAEVKNMQEQLTAVQQYLTETLSDTDDSKAPDLAILDEEEKAEEAEAKVAAAKRKAASALAIAERRATEHSKEEAEEPNLSFLQVEEAGKRPVNSWCIHMHKNMDLSAKKATFLPGSSLYMPTFPGQLLLEKPEAGEKELAALQHSL